MAQAPTDKEAKRQRLFSDISATQLIATALASVTSVLLASYIGIAGSLIGVAVASIVSTLAASLYKRFISVSADKIKHLPVITEPDKTLADILPGRQRDGEGAVGEGTDEPEASSKVKPEEAKPEEQGEEPSPESKEASEGSSGENEEAALAHQKRMIRGLVIVCILSALLAAAATGAVIYFATAGEGIGTKPDPITFVSHPSSEAGTGAASQTAAGESSEADDASSASSSSSSASSSASSSSSSDPAQSGDSSASASSSSSSAASSSSSAGDSGDASENGAPSLGQPTGPQQTNTP